MFCTKCGKELSLNEKFCTSCGQLVDNNKNVSAKAVENTNFFRLLARLFWNKKSSIKNWIKNAVLFFCLYFLSLTILNAIRDSYYSDDNTFVALAPTILIIYLWRKIARRFSL